MPRPIVTQSELLIAEFVEQAEVVDATRLKYRTHLAELLAWLNHPRTTAAGRGGRELTEVETADLYRFQAYLRSDERYAASSHHRVLRRGLSASARKNSLASIHSFYRYLVIVGVLSVDPSAGVRPPRVQRRPGMCLSAEEVRMILDAPGAPRERIQAHLLAYTAARSDEIRRLRWRDVDLVRARITLHGKAGRVRIVDIHPRLMNELRRWYLWLDDEAHRNPAIEVARSNPDTDFVLLTRTGRPLAVTVIARQLKQRATRAGVRLAASSGQSAVSPHALRRTFATLLLDQGHHIDAIADILGHSSIDTTRRHYAFASDARRRETLLAYDI